MSSRVTVRRFRIAIAFAAIVMLASLACSEDRAQRAFERAMSDPSRPLDELRADLESVVTEWPESKAATKARRELESLTALSEAAERGLALRAWDAVREVAKAAESYRARRGRFPESIDDLQPDYLRQTVRDPWGGDIHYLRTPRGYKVLSYGADAIPGGEGDGRDIVVDTGELAR